MTKNRLEQSLPYAALLFLLSACGGGGGGGDGPAPPAPLTLQGTAATGAAIANAPVSAKCSTGNGNATTNASGNYTITIATASLPCVVEVAPAAGAALRSVIAGSGGGTATVNITPLTELVVARVARSAPASFFANFDSTRVTDAAFNAALAQVTSGLQGVVDLTGLNPVTGTLVVGDAHDQKLDQLKAALVKAQSTFAELTTAAVTSSNSMASVNRLVQPAYGTCSGLRSGKYVILNPHEAGPTGLPEYIAHSFTVDAVKMTQIDDVDTTRQEIAINPGTQPCKFTTALRDSIATLYVAKSGVMVWVDPGPPPPVPPRPGRTSLALPAQALLLDDLAGSFNSLAYERPAIGAPFAPASGTMTIDAAGQVTAQSSCSGLAPCTPAAGPLVGFTVNGSGGFNKGPLRYFGFQNTAGDVSLLAIDSRNGSIYVAAEQAALSLPATGEVAHVFDLRVTGSTFTSAETEESTTVTAIDTASQSYTRQRLADGRIDTFTINKPRSGMSYRPAGNSQTTGGGSVAFEEIQVMPLPAGGAVFYTSIAAANNFFGVTLSKP